MLGRVPAAGDGRAVYEAVADSLVALRKVVAVVPWAAEEPSVAASEVFCRNACAAHHARKDFPFLLLEKERGQLVGLCGLHRIS